MVNAIDEYLYGVYGRKDGVTLRDWCDDHGEPYRSQVEDDDEWGEDYVHDDEDE